MTTTAETENYQYLLGLPIVSDLLRENKKLRKRNKELKRLVRLIGNNMSLLTKRENNARADVESDEEDDDVRIVEIKKEKIVVDVLDDVRIVEIKKDKIVVDVLDDDDEPNIAYEIVEEETAEEESGGVRGDESPAEEEAEEEAEESGGVRGDESPAEEEEVYEVTINGKSYYTTNETSGAIYGLDENGDVSLEVGVYKVGKPTFF